MDIVCRKNSCIYNDKFKCNRKHLKVDKKAECDDLNIDKQKPVQDVSKDMFSHEPNFAEFKHCKCIDIACDKNNCIFNKDKKCISNGVLIGSEKSSAPCNSYSPK